MMATFSIRFTTEADVKRWERLEVKGKLGPRQRERLEEWRRTNGNPINNQIGDALLENARDTWRREYPEIDFDTVQINQLTIDESNKSLLAEIERLQLESEGRRKVLFEKAEELRQERLRADNSSMCAAAFFKALRQLSMALAVYHKPDGTSELIVSPNFAQSDIRKWLDEAVDVLTVPFPGAELLLELRDLREALKGIMSHIKTEIVADPETNQNIRRVEIMNGLLDFAFWSDDFTDDEEFVNAAFAAADVLKRNNLGKETE